MGNVAKSLFASKTFWTCAVGLVAEVLTVSPPDPTVLARFGIVLG